MIITHVLRAIEKLKTGPAPTIDLPGVEFHDRRKTAMQAHGPKREWKTRTRMMKSVTGQCWHQAGVDLGERVERYDSVGAHVCVTLARKVIWLHDWDRLGMFANGWNDATVSIEVSGLFAGIDGDINTVWQRKAPNVLTPELAATCRDVASWITVDANARGANVRVYVSHRQSSATRRSDPGQAIYRDVVLAGAAADGVKTAPTTVLGDGLPVPEAWDPAQVGVRY